MPEFLSLKTASRFAIACMGVLLAGAVVFYKQRMLFSDSCFMIFELLNNKRFLIQESRYGSFITQMVPLIGGVLHLPLKIIMIAYSLSFNLFYFVVILLVYRFKQYGLAILMSFYYVLFASETFFWPNNEVHQGIAWMFLFFGVFLSKERDKNYSVLSKALLFVLALLAISCHHIVIIPFTFLWLFFWLEKDSYGITNNTFKIFSIPFALLIILKIAFIQFGFYDKGKLSSLKHLDFNSAIHIFSSPQSKNFLSLCLTNYWVVIPVFIAGIISLMFEKKYKTALLIILFFLAYFVSICFVFTTYDKKQLFYLESEWMGLSIIVATPFVFSFLSRLKSRQASIVVCAVLIIRFTYIGFTIPVFVKRTSFVATTTRLIKTKGLSKVIIKNIPFLDETLLMNWGTPYESIFCSALDGYSPQVNFVVMPENELAGRLPVNKNEILNAWGTTKCSELNTFYFHIDTTEAYHIMTYDELTGK